jgi:hypothetical protein
VVHSNGFHDKVTNNPVMAQESRNQAVIMASDGIPYFKEGNTRKGYPIAMRLANPPDEMGKSSALTHLLGLMSCEYWERSEHTGKAVRVSRSPKSMKPLLYRLADEFHELYHEGFRAIEFSSSALNEADRIFTLRVVILFWIGDYPGQGEVSGFRYNFYNNEVIVN